MSLRDLSPLRVIIGNDDVTPYLQDSGFTFSNVDPGGFESLSAQFPRDMPTTLRGLPIRVDSGLHVAWEGRVAQVQRSLGNNTVITGEGYGALLKDRAQSMVFVDRDMTRWGSPSYQRQANLISVSLNTDGLSFQMAADPGGLPSLVFSGAYPWAGNQIVEAWYDAGPDNVIAVIYVDSSSQINGAYAFTTTASTGELNIGSVADAVGSGFSGSHLIAVGSSIQILPSVQRYALISVSNDGPDVSGSPPTGVPIGIALSNPAVYGNHGLTGRGATPQGFYPSDIAGFAISQVPGLQLGVTQLTDASNYIVPHSAYYAPVTLDQIVADMATAQGWHWGVWESPSPLIGDARPRCDFRPRPAPGAFTAFCRRQDCSNLDIREDLTQQYNVAVVTYTDVAGVPGAAVVTTGNPILDAAAIPLKVLPIPAGTMTPATAALYGAEILAITNVQQRVAGTIEIISPIDTGVGYAPAWLLKAGIDRLRIADVPSTDAFGSMSDYPISRVECSLSSGGFSTSVEIGSGASLVETLNARVQAATALAGQGG